MKFIKSILVTVMLAVLFSFSFNTDDSFAQNKDTKTGQNQTTTSSTTKKKHKKHHHKHKKHKKTTKTDINTKK